MPHFRFNLPQITLLTKDQKLAYNPKLPMLVTGGPGSGKTVVTIYRFLRAVRNEKKIILFTFNRTLIYSIKGTLRDRAEELFGNLDQKQIDDIVDNQLSTFFIWHKNNVCPFNDTADEDIVAGNFASLAANGNYFEELFIDEGQDLPPAVYSNIFTLADSVSVGADRAQNYRRYYEDDEVEDIILENLKKQKHTQDQYLGENFRNTMEIFELARKFVPNNRRVQDMDVSEFRRGNKPDIRSGLDQLAQLDIIMQVISQNRNANIGILLHFRNEFPVLRAHLEKNGYSCAQDAPEASSYSYYYNDMNGDDELVVKKKLCSPFITTFESCKGLEFDIVIMPFFENSEPAMRKLNREGRAYATQNHYYVAVTRAKNEIFILCNEPPPSLPNVTEEEEEEELPF
ncbi:3'-5' exonuclease [Pedobacter sp. GR22-10]|uniref:3'-5' exonuclease n=1 Tax=Pedobacter sp. GR22-10 TaxID=2994472 RepID=UPI00224527F7|nr:3'-5' exonuclease [Pedobacter sp. GR22-10]MCX2430658.1 UvrD-helicase domain-containing protein [Pedobacter sp. GR22-10]